MSGVSSPETVADTSRLGAARSGPDPASCRRASPIFWWRDDDAVAATPQLDRLLDLAKRTIFRGLGGGAGTGVQDQQKLG